MRIASTKFWICVLLGKDIEIIQDEDRSINMNTLKINRLFSILFTRAKHKVNKQYLPNEVDGNQNRESIITNQDPDLN